MTLGQKIRQLIKDKSFKTIHDFHLAMKKLYGSNAITRRTLTRVLKNQVKAEIPTLNQIAVTLDVKTSSLREGTDAEITTTVTTLPYNKMAVIYGLRKDLPFAPERLVLRPGGCTAREQDRPDALESVKWFVVARGAVTLIREGVPGEERRTFRMDEEFAFDARQVHYFVNANHRRSVIYIIHYPTRNSPLFLFND